MEISKHIGQGFAKGELHDTLVQMQMEAGAMPISGPTYFCSKYGNGTTGLSWENAFTTIAAAITAANTYNTSSGGLGRTRIYIDSGPGWSEDLAIFPNNCDMVGVGSNPRIQGVVHITTAVENCHLFNIAFRNAVGDTATPLVKITPYCHGLWFINCIFDTRCICTAALELVYHGNQKIKIKGCNFYGNWQPLVGIQLDGGFMLSEISNNYIRATETGILVASACTTWDYHSIIKENVIVGIDHTESSLARGISLLSSVGNSKMVIISNWISADAAIYYANDASGHAADVCIDNHVTEGGTGGIEVVLS